MNFNVFLLQSSLTSSDGYGLEFPFKVAVMGEAMGIGEHGAWTESGSTPVSKVSPLHSLTSTMTMSYDSVQRNSSIFSLLSILCHVWYLFQLREPPRLGSHSHFALWGDCGVWALCLTHTWLVQQRDSLRTPLIWEHLLLFGLVSV